MDKMNEITIFTRQKKSITNFKKQKNNFKRKIAFIIPALNEEIALADTIKALLENTSANDIYIADDGSTDATTSIAKEYTPNVISFITNKGKAHALNLAIQEFNLINRYEYIMPIDADTIVTKSFKDNALAILQADNKNTITCVVGKVTASNHCWMTKYRLWEYEIAQMIHKSAQDKENAILVCSGCATVYRSAVFSKLEIPIDTLTEDMDLTFLIHRKKIGRIVYLKNALVITQDPHSLNDFIKQIYRWYSGFWQCIEKHNIPWGGQTLDLEVGIMALEGLFNSLLVIGYLFITLFIFIPAVNERQSIIILFPFLIDLLFFLIPTLFLTVKRYKVWDIFLYIPHFYMLRMIGALVFLMSFIRVVLGIDFQLKWHHAKRLQLLPENRLWEVNQFSR